MIKAALLSGGRPVGSLAVLFLVLCCCAVLCCDLMGIDLSVSGGYGEALRLWGRLIGAAGLAAGAFAFAVRGVPAVLERRQLAEALEDRWEALDRQLAEAKKAAQRVEKRVRAVSAAGGDSPALDRQLAEAKKVEANIGKRIQEAAEVGTKGGEA